MAKITKYIGINEVLKNKNKFGLYKKIVSLKL